MLTAAEKRWVAMTAKNRAMAQVKDAHFEEYQMYYKKEADTLRAELETKAEQTIRAKYFAEFQAELENQKQ